MVPASEEDNPGKRGSLLGRLRRLVPIWSQLSSLRSDQQKLQRDFGKQSKRQAAAAAELRQEVRLAMRQLDKRLGRIDGLLTDIEKQQRQARRERRRMFEKLDAVLRRDYLDVFLADDLPARTLARRFNLLSQNEEDGMILALLQAVGVETRTFVELGSGMSGGNSGMLAEEFGWRGMMVELDPVRVAKCAERFGRGGRVACLCAEISPGNINQLIEDNGLAGEVDFFSLDIDSFDYWVLEAMTACQPRIMVLEYNANFGAEAAVTVPLGAPLARGPKGYHGASLAAMTKLADSKGYRLLACDRSGTNAFFLRNDLRPEVPAVPAGEAFMPRMIKTSALSEPRPDKIDVIGLAEKHELPLQYV